jgi:uncharacterized membrane protein YecN with MAPEG domain
LSEQVPLALLLLPIALVEGCSARRPPFGCHALGVVLVLARLSSAWGLSHSLGPTQARQAGAGLTLAVVVVASLMIFYRLLIAR